MKRTLLIGLCTLSACLQRQLSLSNLSKSKVVWDSVWMCMRLVKRKMAVKCRSGNAVGSSNNNGRLTREKFGAARGYVWMSRKTAKIKMDAKCRFGNALGNGNKRGRQSNAIRSQINTNL